MEKNFTDLDHVEAREWMDFFRNLRVFRGWSTDSLRNLLYYTRLCKFNKKQIISANTKSSADVFIVKNGQVLVWTQLKRNTNSVVGHADNLINSNFKDTSANSFLSHDKGTLSQDSPRSSKTDIRSLNMVRSKESFNNKLKQESTFFKSRFASNSRESLQKSFNDTSFHLPNISRKPSRKGNRKTPQLNNWDNYFQNQSTFYLEVLKLKRGDAFGLDSNLVKEHPNCQLISDECECFLIDKDAFLNYSPSEFSQVLQYEYNQGFPTRAEIDVKFNEYVKWKSYRKKVFQETAIQRIRSKITSFR